MLKRMLSLIRRDTSASLRDFILIYGLAAPFLLALIIRAFIPAVGGTSINLVVTPDIGQAMIDRLNEYAVVEVVADRAALEGRVLALDDAAGIVPDPASAGTNGEAAGPGEVDGSPESTSGYRIILQGNEAHDTAVLPGVILADILEARPVEITQEDLGRAASPIKPMMAIVLALTALMIGGMVVGFNIIEDKETGTLSALAVSPLSRLEYVAGRSLLGIAMSVVLVLGSLYLMGAGPFNVFQVFLVTLAGAALAVIFGFYIGAISENQISGIASLKFGSLLFLVGPVLSAVLPERWQPTLYWMPTYWTYLGYQEVFQVGGAAWSEVVRLAAISLAVGLAFLAASWRLFSRRLSLRG